MTDPLVSAGWLAARLNDADVRVVDATLPLVEQQDLVREIVSKHLKGVLRTEPSAWRSALTSEALYGRYIDEVLHKKES